MLDAFYSNNFIKITTGELSSKDVKQEFDFDNKKILGSGTYGKVFKVISKKDNKEYALKCIKPTHEREGFPITSLREIKFLTQLKHENVIQIKAIYSTMKKDKNKLRRIKTYCAMDFLPFEFYRIIRDNYKQKFFLNFNQIRAILYQCFQGLKHIHQNRIIHRDIKSFFMFYLGANILMSQEGIVKIADFGLAKFIPKFELCRKTPIVVTLYYRAPEVLLTKGEYDFKLDIWSMGCFALELALNQPLFTAKDETQQIEQIFQLCGSPNQFTWPKIMESDLYKKCKPSLEFQRKLISTIRNQRMDFDDELLDLLDKIFVLNPDSRYDMNQILNHSYFTKYDLIQDNKELLHFIQNQQGKPQPQQEEQKKKPAPTTRPMIEL